MDQRLERILPRVQKPARYTGGGPAPRFLLPGYL